MSAREFVMAPIEPTPEMRKAACKAMSPTNKPDHWVSNSEKHAIRYRAMLAAAPPIDAKYLIWSNEHRAWWRPEERGYTTHLSMAGRYSHDVAMKICRAARGGWRPGDPPPEIPIAEADAIDCEQWAIRGGPPE